jgi:hypothetical protein
MEYLRYSLSEKQPRTFSPLSKSFENVVVDKVTSDTVVQLSDVVCATFNNPNFIASTIPTHTIHLCIIWFGFLALQTLTNVRYTY